MKREPRILDRRAFMTGVALTALTGCAARVQTPRCSPEEADLTFRALATDYSTYSDILSWRPDSRVPAASVAKLMIAIALFELSPSALETNANPQRGAQSVDELLRAMIVESDNAAANALIDLLVPARINEVSRNIGTTMRFTGHYHGSRFQGDPRIFTTARECTRMLRYIVNSARDGRNALRAHNFSRLLRLMLEQSDGRFFRSATTARTPIANKTGEISGELNDVAIVDPFGERPLLLTLLCSGEFSVEMPREYDCALSMMRSKASYIYAKAEGWKARSGTR